MWGSGCLGGGWGLGVVMTRALLVDISDSVGVLLELWVPFDIYLPVA